MAYKEVTVKQPLLLTVLPYVSIAAFFIEEYELRGTRELKLTHEQIGSHLGSAREVITRMLKHFQRDGLIRSGRGSIVLEDLSGLYRLAEKSLR